MPLTPHGNYSFLADAVFIHNCPINERTADGVLVGRCWMHLKDGKTCPRHGDVSAAVELYKRTGKLTAERPHAALAQDVQESVPRIEIKPTDLCAKVHCGHPASEHDDDGECKHAKCFCGRFEIAAPASAEGGATLSTTKPFTSGREHKAGDAPSGQDQTSAPLSEAELHRNECENCDRSMVGENAICITCWNRAVAPVAAGTAPRAITAKDCIEISCLSSHQQMADAYNRIAFGEGFAASFYTAGREYKS